MWKKTLQHIYRQKFNRKSNNNQAKKLHPYIDNLINDDDIKKAQKESYK